MIVNQINTFPYGGAAAAANRIHCRLLEKGIDSRFLYEKTDREVVVPNAQRIRWANQKSKNVVGRLLERRRVKRIHRMYDQHLANRDRNLELFSMCELVDARYLCPSDFKNQIIHLHWVAFLADYPYFFRSVPTRTPVVWTLHDMNPMTGGCHYSNGCNLFENGCGHCPQILESGKKDLSSFSFGVKQRALRDIDLTIIGPSKWILDLARSSPVFPEQTRFELIRLGFDLKQLYPVETALARKQLKTDTDRVVIGFGAESINNHRKGFDLLLRALAQIKNRDAVECFVFGSGGEVLNQMGLPKIRNFGFIDDQKTLQQFYSACDFVVVPSREDNQPQVGLEAMACGTPVVAFDVGGVSEYVRDGLTGLIANLAIESQLAEKIDQLVENHELRLAMSGHCRDMMEVEFNIDIQAQKYLDVYQSLLANQSVAA